MTRRTGGGRLFHRRSRHTGKELPTWWMGFYVAGEKRERQETTGTDDYEAAKQALRQKLGEVGQGRVKPRSVEKLTVNDLLALVAQEAEDKGRTVPDGHIEAWAHELGPCRALDVESEELEAIVRKWKRALPGRAGTRSACGG